MEIGDSSRKSRIVIGVVVFVAGLVWSGVLKSCLLFRDRTLEWHQPGPDSWQRTTTKLFNNQSVAYDDATPCRRRRRCKSLVSQSNQIKTGPCPATTAT